MKILHINSYYSMSKFYKNLYEQQIKNNIDISVFVPVASEIKNEEDLGKYTTVSVNHSKYDRFIFHLKHKKILKDIENKYNIEDYSMIHAHSLFSNGYIAMRLKEIYGIPYIVAVRNTDVNIFFKKMLHLRRLGIKILNEANSVVFLSESYKNLVLNSYVPEKNKELINKKSVIIPNGIDEFWFKNMNLPKTVIKKGSLKLLQVGDINKNKNIETTLKSADLLIKEGYKVKVNIVGKVKDKNIFNRIKKYNNVNFLGYKSKEELIDIYRQNDIFILPSVNETFGLVYVEAMSQGLPLIYTKGQGFDGHFNNGVVGYSVDCYNEVEITNSIKNILKSYENISGRCIDKSKLFNWVDINQRVVDLYKKLP